MELLIFRQVLALLLAGIAAYFDLKSGIIPDKLNYAGIIAGAAICLFEFNLFGFGIAAIVFAFGYLLYLGGKIGGGDVKMFAALALLVPFYNGRIFIVDLLLVSSIAALVFISVYYLLKYYAKGIKIEENKKNFPYAALLLAFSALYIYALYSVMHAPILLVAGISFLLLIACAFIALERGIRKEFFLEKINLEKLDEDEIIAYEFMDEKTKKIILGESRVMKGVLGTKEIENLKKAKITEVPVYRDLPKFAPFVFIGMLVVFLVQGIVSKIVFV